MTFRENWESGRPPGSEKMAEKGLFNAALAYRSELRRRLEGIDFPIFAITPGAVDDLAVAIAGLAEDIHADAGLWRSLEACHLKIFGVPLPVIFRAGDGELDVFDERRFRFFLYSVWQLFQPGAIVSPTHRGFLELANHAAAFFREALARLSRRSPVAEYLGRTNHRGWDVKRKLVWLGTKSFLFRLFHRDYMYRNCSESDDKISTTDDFLCQECTAWSGLGVIDILAMALNLPEADRESLQVWNERHAAVYRVVKVSPDGRGEALLELVNEVNGQPYRVRIGKEPGANAFRPGTFLFGSLVPWRGDWYWSGMQRILPLSPAELAGVRKKLRELGPISYRYCPDLEMKAREFEAKHRAEFEKFHGADLAVFRNGAEMATTESKRLGFPNAYEGLKEARDRTAIFYHAGEGVEIFTGYGELRSGLEKPPGEQTEEERGAIESFIGSKAISPDFVRRVIGETGTAAIEGLYFLQDAPDGIEYLMRRFKGCFFRRRYPSLSLRE